MISRVLREIVRLVLWLVMATICTYALLFVVVAISRYERTEGSCPDVSLDRLRNKVLLRLEEHGIPPDGIRFDGTPQYHAWKLGMWEFPLLINETRYIAMIDCNEQLSSYWQMKDQPANKAGQVLNRQ